MSTTELRTRYTAPPAYRERDGQGVVTLTDAGHKRRRDYYLGEYGTPESRERYYRLIAAWESAGRHWPPAWFDRPGVEATSDLRINEVIAEYWEWAREYYRPQHAKTVACALRLLRQFYGQSRAVDFGPKRLRLLREEMIRGDAHGDPPRNAWARKFINSQVQRIRHMFKWAAARELVPVTIHQALCTLEPLKRGRTVAREGRKVTPVPEHLIEGTLPHLSRPVRALVELQRLTGARPGELLGLRRCDLIIDTNSGVWSYQPEEHKTAYCERDRIIYFGPQAQAILGPFLLNRKETEFLFSPAEAEADRREALHEARKTPLSCGNRPGTNRRDNPLRKPGDRYTTVSYYRAIDYACKRAFPPPAPLARREGETTAEWRRRLTEHQKQQVRQWYREHRWHPHQLRHNAATELRQKFGLEAAQLTLGHASAQITDAIYAERDQAKVMEIMRRIG